MYIHTYIYTLAEPQSRLISAPRWAQTFGYTQITSIRCRALLQITPALRTFPKLRKKHKKRQQNNGIHSRVDGGNAKPNTTDKYGVFGSSALKTVIKKQKYSEEAAEIDQQHKPLKPSPSSVLLRFY